MWAVTRTSCRSGRSLSKSARSPVLRSASPMAPAGHPQLPGRLHEDPYERASLPPAVDGPAGIEEIWKDAHNRGLTTEDFEGPRYVRLKRIQQLASQGRLDLADLRMRPLS